MSEALKIAYASAPIDEFLINALEIEIDGIEPLLICDGYEHQVLGGRNFRPSSISVSLPRKANTGQQNLVFGLWNAYGEAQEYVDKALSTNSSVKVTYYQYLSSDKDNYALKLPAMTVVGGTFQGIQAKFEASYQDLLNLAFPRERYTSETSPAIQYWN